MRKPGVMLGGVMLLCVMPMSIRMAAKTGAQNTRRVAILAARLIDGKS
jgi:hypothetical protein